MLGRPLAFELLPLCLLGVTGGADKANVLTAAALGDGRIVVRLPAAQQVVALGAAFLLLLHQLVLVGLRDGLALSDEKLANVVVAHDGGRLALVVQLQA